MHQSSQFDSQCKDYKSKIVESSSFLPVSVQAGCTKKQLFFLEIITTQLTTFFKAF